MKKLKFDTNKEKYCYYCTYGKLLEYTEEVFCVKKGFVNKFDKCMRFKYDPLKRKPEPSASKPVFNEEDFKL